MDNEIGLYLFLALVVIGIVVIAVRLMLAGQFNEMIFQLRMLQTKIETLSKSLDELADEVIQNVQQSVDAAHAKGKEDAAEKQNDSDAVQNTIPEPTIDYAPKDDNAAQTAAQPDEKVQAVNETQRVGGHVPTIVVPVSPVDTNTDAETDALTNAETDALTNQNAEQLSAEGEKEVGEKLPTSADNEALANEERHDERQTTTNNADQQAETQPQEGLQEHEPVGAFATNDVEEQQAVTEEKMHYTGKEYLEMLRKQSETGENNEAGTSQAYNAPQTSVKTGADSFNFEKFIGENLLGKIGILVLVLGIGFFVKYAIDKNWIGHTMRTALGFAVGTALLGIALKLNKRYRSFSSLLAGGGCAVYYVTTSIAYNYYELFSQPVAFGIMVVVTAFMAWTAHHYERRELAVTAIVGGFLAPFLAATDMPNFLFLYAYMSVLNLGSFSLSWGNRWNELPLVSTMATYMVLSLSGHDYGSLSVGVQIAFFALFWVLANASSFTFLRRGMTGVFTGLHIAAMMFSSMFTLFFIANVDDYCKYTSATTALVMGAAYVALHLWLRHSEEQESAAQVVFLALGVTYLSISLPWFFTGAMLRVCFSAEMVLLLWLYCRLGIRVYGIAAAIAVAISVVVVAIGLTDDVPEDVTIPVFNSAFMATLFQGLCIIAFARIMDRYRERVQAFYTPGNLLIYGVGILCIYNLISREMDAFVYSPTYNAAVTLLRIATLFGVALGFGKRFAVGKYGLLYVGYMFLATFFIAGDVFFYRWFVDPMAAIGLQWLGIGCTIGLYVHASMGYYRQAEQPLELFTIFLNVASTLLWVSMVRILLLQMGVEQFSAPFSLAMAAVGALQMTLGMRLRNKTMRWLSIATFGIIITKLALYDVWLMPAVGRIVVFIILGALFLTVSFMYQKLKDKLNLGGEDEVYQAAEDEVVTGNDEAQDERE